MYTSDLEDYIIFTDRGQPYGDGDVVRLGCGTAFTTGKDESNRYYLEEDGPAACAELEKPRRVVGLVLAAIGVIGLFVATRLLRVREPQNS
ncbi:MAG TPA: hypothetical protein VE172_11655 [Stackebrandtia sp.]|uniref:hypothetical protein n=1 Tax=Stackebrandtia sp. TaxID=2023065 RepID=UPI002D27091B|nr:hypothetical protein [Stackebrandtia sp.]HZE39453.1 hypothetical protein [Stackebrandtia sp.]